MFISVGGKKSVEFFLLFDTKNSIIIIYPETSGSNIISCTINFISILGIIMAIYGVTGLFFGGIGFFYKSMKVSGILKKKYLYLSLGFIFFMIFAPLDGVISSINVLSIPIRICVILSFWFWYYSLKEAPLEKPKFEKQINIQESLFRLFY